MEHEYERRKQITSHKLLRLLLLRISVIGLYLAAYKNITAITKTIHKISSYPVSFLLFVYESKAGFHLKEPFIKEFVLIILFSSTLIPIFQSLLQDIATDTIFLLFGLCQIIFCIDTVKASIINEGRFVNRKFNRKDPIPLEESLLISRNSPSDCIFGYTAALIGFIGVFSRITDSTEVLILQAIGFVLYMFLPAFLEKRNVHESPIRSLLIICSFMCYFLVLERMLCALFVLKLLVIFSFCSVCIKLLETSDNQRCLAKG